MKICISQKSRFSGIALMMVLAVIFVLTVIAAGFAFSMKVEMQLAKNHLNESEMELLAISGVEMAKYVLGQQLNVVNQPYDALNQKWAGGVGDTNDLLADISLDDNVLGNGSFSLKITDLERKANINAADQMLLQRAFTLIGVDAVDYSTAIDSILDWIDNNDNPRLNGAESDYYLSLDPPYLAKNGPIDDITELLLIKGITPEMFWGLAGSDEQNRIVLTNYNATGSTFGVTDKPVFQGGLYDLFTPISSGLININTASAAVLQLIPGIDENIAQRIVQMRDGPDGVEGNEDDIPFRNKGELINVPGIDNQIISQISRYCTVRSTFFEVQITTKMGKYQRTYIAVLRRANPRDIQTLFFHPR